MNKKALELGLENTHFVTAHGLDDEEHYTTAYELAKITDYALNNKKIATIVNTKTTTININGNPKTINNTNELLGYLNGVDGVKTGFTNNAGRCLVTSTTRNGHQIICIVLGADTKKIRTSDSIKLIEYAFSKFEYIDIKEKIEKEFETWKNENISRFKVIKGRNQNMNISLGKIDCAQIPINKNNIKDIKVQIQCEQVLEAPIQENQVIGSIEVKVKDEIIAKTDIISSKNIPKKNILTYMQQLILNYSTYIQEALEQR